MVSVDESKTFCLYCRGEIIHNEEEKPGSLQLQQYHQECFNEIIKDNHCEYCSELLNELNNFFTDEGVKIHQACFEELKDSIHEKIVTRVKEYLQGYPLKGLAKQYAFYEMKEAKFTLYVEDLLEEATQGLPDYLSKTEAFQKLIQKITNESLQEEIAGYIKSSLQKKLNEELKKCRPDVKKDFVEKILRFMWNYYLEIPISYKDRINHKVLPKPSLDSVNCTIFHYKLVKLFNTPLDFNSIVNSNYNDLADYLMSQPLSIQHLDI